MRMRNWMLLGASVAVVAVQSQSLSTALSAPGVAGAYPAGIGGSPHDMSGKLGVTISGAEICKPCHTPHFTGTTSYKIWNHQPSVGPWTLYKSTYILDTTSKLCLSCHDGTIAIDAYGGFGGPAGQDGAGTHFMPSDHIIGSAGTGDLTHSHPVGAIYPGWDGTTWTGPSYYNSPLTWGSAKPKLISGAGTGVATGVYQVGCTTCHDPHRSADSRGNFLRVDNHTSALCLNCHIK